MTAANAIKDLCNTRAAVAAREIPLVNNVAALERMP